jgi:all-trans-retinol 13,14-reductase
MAEVIVIGAGLGGLACATKLARAGRSVLLLEKNPHPGGTSYIFRRGPYSFPMGPLSFSHPARVRAILEELRVQAPADFARNHFQLLAPGLDIIYSRPLRVIQKDLNRFFPPEVQGIEAVISELERLITSLALEQDLHSRPLDESPAAIRTGQPVCDSSSRNFLELHITQPLLLNFLGSQGTGEPEMSLLDLARAWNAAGEVGIWFPSGGIHGLADSLQASFQAAGGEVLLGTTVKQILIKKGRAVGVQTASGKSFSGDWVVSNADYKKTFLEMLGPGHIPPGHMEKVSAVPSTGSELCVYLGIDPVRVDLSRMIANHVFYRKCPSPTDETRLEDFDSREVEICLWSQNMPDSAPAGKAALVLRTSFPYDHFAGWRTGEKKRAEGYRIYKDGLARKLIQTVETLLPGLSRSIEVSEVATPLTYRDWGNRTQGSIAGWTWSTAQSSRFGQKVLLETPVDRLLMCGIYSVTKLFWGGVPTALTTGLWAAERILA